MTINNEDAFEAVMGQATADILDIFDKGIPIDGDCAVKIHVMGTVTVRDRRDQDCLGWDASHGPFANLRCQTDINVNGEMRAVIFVGSHGHNSHATFFSSGFTFIPNHFSIAVFHDSLLIVIFWSNEPQSNSTSSREWAGCRESNPQQR